MVWGLFLSLRGAKIQRGLNFLGEGRRMGGGGLSTFSCKQNPLIEICLDTLQPRDFLYLPKCFIALCKWWTFCWSKTFSSTLCFVIKTETNWLNWRFFWLFFVSYVKFFFICIHSSEELLKAIKNFCYKDYINTSLKH